MWPLGAYGTSYLHFILKFPLNFFPILVLWATVGGSFFGQNSAAKACSEDAAFTYAATISTALLQGDTIKDSLE